MCSDLGTLLLKNIVVSSGNIVTIKYCCILSYLVINIETKCSITNLKKICYNIICSYVEILLLHKDIFPSGNIIATKYSHLEKVFLQSAIFIWKQYCYKMVLFSFGNILQIVVLIRKHIC